MDKKLKRLMDKWEISDAEDFKADLERFGEDEVSNDTVDRILSSTLKKAGLEQQDPAPDKKGLITMNRINADNKIDRITETGKVIHFRRGAVIAACLAIVAASTFAVNTLVGGKIGTDEDNNSKIQIAQTSKPKIPVPADSGVTDEESNSDEEEIISETDSLSEKKDKNSSEKSDNSADSKPVNGTSEEEDKGGHAHARNPDDVSEDISDENDMGGHAHARNPDDVNEEISDENDMGGHAHAVNYEGGYILDDDEYVSFELTELVNNTTILCEGTITSKEIYGRTRKNEFKPLKDYSESELDNMGRLYYRCTLRLDGTCFKGEEYLNDLSQSKDYDPANGEMIVIIPVPRKAEYSDGGAYAEKEYEMEDPDLYSAGDKLLVGYNVVDTGDGINIFGNGTFKYDAADHMYHDSSFYVNAPSFDELTVESMTEYLINSFKGGSVETAEKWISYLGENSVIRNTPSKRFASGQVVSVRYSPADGGFVIYAAE